jgi:hypothetical protein
MANQSNLATPTTEREVRSRHRAAPGSGARTTGPGPGRKKRGLLPLLLGLLALAAIAALLFALLSGDDDNATTGGTQEQQEATGGTASAGAGTLTAGGEDMLSASDGGLGQFAGARADGRDVVVQSVVRMADDPTRIEGFWVGTSATDRVYVECGGEVGRKEGTFQPEEGQTVNLGGPVQQAPADPARELKLNEADARLVAEQGAFINADRVRAAE